MSFGLIHYYLTEKKKTKQNPLVPGVCAGAGCLGAPGAEGRMLQKQFWKVTL